MKTSVSDEKVVNKGVFKSLVDKTFPVTDKALKDVKVTEVNPRSIIRNVMNNRGETQGSKKSLKFGVNRSDLLESVQAEGVREALILFRPSTPCPKGPHAGKYKGSLVLIDGHNRLDTALYLHLDKVPAKIYENIDWDTAYAMSLTLNDGGDTLKRQLSVMQFIYAVKNLADGMKYQNPSEIAKRLTEARLRIEAKLSDRKYFAETLANYKQRVEMALSVLESPEALRLLRNSAFSFPLAAQVAYTMRGMKTETRAYLCQRLMKRFGSGQGEVRDKTNKLGPSVWRAFCNEVDDFSKATIMDIKNAGSRLLNGKTLRLRGESYRSMRATETVKSSSSLIVLPEETLDINDFDAKRAKRIEAFYKWALRCYKSGRKLAAPAGIR